MNDKLELSPFVVILNSEKTIEYFRDRPLNQTQQNDLTATDNKLNLGINIAGKYIEQPTDQDKAIFMANILVHALENDDETKNYGIYITSGILSESCSEKAFLNE